MAGKKLDKLQRQEEEKLEVAVEIKTERQAVLDAAEMFGAIRLMEGIAKNFSAQVIRGLQAFQEQKGYEFYGFTSFDDFLDNSPKSPMKKSKYYDLKKVLETEGDRAFDALNSLNVPMSARKLIGDGQIQIDGDEIVIGEQRTNLADLPGIKMLIKELANENRQLTETAEKNKKHYKAQQEKLETGTREFEELRRQFDSLQEGDPHDKALMKLLGAMVKLREAVKDLPFVEKDKRSELVLNTLWAQICGLRHEYCRYDFVFEDGGSSNNGNKGEVDDLVRDVMTETGDFDDEDEA